MRKWSQEQEYHAFNNNALKQHDFLTNYCIFPYSVLENWYIIKWSESKWVHFQGTQLRHFHFHLLSQLGSTLKEKNLLLREQILSFKRRPLLRKSCVAQWSKKEVPKISPFGKKILEGAAATTWKGYLQIILDLKMSHSFFTALNKPKFVHPNLAYFTWQVTVADRV